MALGLAEGQLNANWSTIGDEKDCESSFLSVDWMEDDCVVNCMSSRRYSLRRRVVVSLGGSYKEEEEEEEEVLLLHYSCGRHSPP